MGPPRTGRQLRVVSYNVHGLRDDRAALVQLLRELAPDVLVLQEAPRRLRWRQRCAALAHSLDLVVAVGGMPALGNLILTDLRVTVKQTWSVRFPLTPGRHLRGAAIARCLIAGAPLLVAGSHLSIDPVERPAQARRLAATIAGLAEPAEPVVLGADVNDQPGSRTWAALTGGALTGGALTEPSTGAPVAAPVGALDDTAGAAGGAPTFGGPTARRCIDAVFADPRLRVHAHRVVDTPLARRASDHLPVVADLEL
jgi:endonuclease/exonuclease/phosphatase family metal-dependent hydrolase